MPQRKGKEGPFLKEEYGSIKRTPFSGGKLEELCKGGKRVRKKKTLPLTGGGNTESTATFRKTGKN